MRINIELISGGNEAQTQLDASILRALADKLEGSDWPGAISTTATNINNPDTEKASDTEKVPESDAKPTTKRRPGRPRKKAAEPTETTEATEPEATEPEATETTEATEPEATEPEATEPEDSGTPAVLEDAPSVDTALDEARAILRDDADNGKDRVQAALKAAGAARVTHLKPSQVQDFLAALRK